MRKTWKTAFVAAGLVAAVGCQDQNTGRRVGGGVSDDSLMRDRAHLAQVQADERQRVATLRAEAAKKKDQVDEDTQRKVAREQKRLTEARADVVKDENKLAGGIGGSGTVDRRGVEDHPGAMAGATAPVRAAPIARPEAQGEGAHLLTGTLGGSSGSSVTLRAFNGEELKLGTDARTRVFEHGKAVKLSDFREGTEVRASYILHGKDRIARDVQILPTHPVTK